MKMNKRKLASAAAAGIGFALGTVNPAYVIGLRKGYDIRKRGSGNAGASNLLMLEGKKAGVLVMAFDISKAAVSVELCRKLFPKLEVAGELAGAGCIFGHMYPPLMGFKGGKGLACLGGTILAFSTHDFAAALFAETVLLMATRYLCLVPITASVLYPIYHGITTGNWKGAGILGSVALPMFSKHIENLKRIADGTELKIDFLWDKEAELERIGWVDEE